MPSKETDVQGPHLSFSRGYGHRVENSSSNGGRGHSKEGHGLGLTVDYCIGSC